MTLKSIIFVGLIALCWVSVVSAQNVSVSLRGRIATGPITELRDILIRLGIRLPRQLREMMKRFNINVDSPSSDLETPAQSFDR